MVGPERSDTVAWQADLPLWGVDVSPLSRGRMAPPAALARVISCLLPPPLRPPPMLSTRLLRLRHRPSSCSSPLRFIAAAAMSSSSSSSTAAPGGGRKPNRLAAEHSPYLLQHAHNPVDWYPWGDEAFEKARKLDIPIFLSSAM